MTKEEFERENPTIAALLKTSDGKGTGTVPAAQIDQVIDVVHGAGVSP